MLKEILRTYITAYFYFFYEPYNKINLGIMVILDFIYVYRLREISASYQLIRIL